MWVDSADVQTLTVCRFDLRVSVERRLMTWSRMKFFIVASPMFSPRRWKICVMCAVRKIFGFGLASKFTWAEITASIYLSVMSFWLDSNGPIRQWCQQCPSAADRVQIVEWPILRCTPRALGHKYAPSRFSRRTHCCRHAMVSYRRRRPLDLERKNFKTKLMNWLIHVRMLNRGRKSRNTIILGILKCTGTLFRVYFFSLDRLENGYLF